MKVLNGKQKPYTPSWKMKTNYLAARFAMLKKQQEELRRAAENAEQQNTRPETW
jgi:hypothetical protein